MKATLPKTSTENGRNHSGKRELTDYWKVVALRNGEFVQPIDCRCWMGRSNQASTVYASIWIRGKNGASYAGHGDAGGYGYHKASAAVDSAIRSAGIELDQSIHGVGENAIHEAMEAIARALGYRKFTIVSG